MKTNNKFKLISNNKIPLFRTTNRILNFKKSKWIVVKKRFGRQRLSSFTNLCFKKVYTNRILRSQNFFKNFLLKKRKLKYLFQDNKSVLNSDKNDLTLNFLRFHIGKPLFNLSILLWYLNVSKSFFDSSQKVNTGAVLVNNKNVSTRCFLKKGDIITFSKKSIHLDFLFNNRYLFDVSFLSFLELDYYTNTIVIIKDLDELCFEDYNIFVQNNLEIDFNF